MTLAPQAGQKRTPVGSSAPHRSQRAAIELPQSTQNLASSGFSAPQTMQRLTTEV
jgi:hypothetical protein